MHADAALILIDSDAMMVGAEPVMSGARTERLQQKHLQVAAMDRELRMLVARGAAQRLLIDQLTEAIEEGGVLRRDRGPRQIGFEAERGQLPGGMRKQIDTDADRADFSRRLEYSTGNSRRVQRQPQRQPANAGPDDDDVVHISSRHLL